MGKEFSLTEALEKARAACARQERAHQEMRDKLYGWGLHRDEVEHAIGQLISEGYLNEQRFAEAYALGRFRQKGWGRVKIRAGLRERRVSEACIKLGLATLDGDEYMQRLAVEAEKRYAKERSADTYQRTQRTIRHLLNKGYESDLVRDVMRSMGHT